MALASFLASVVSMTRFSVSSILFAIKTKTGAEASVSAVLYQSLIVFKASSFVTSNTSATPRALRPGRGLGEEAKKRG